MISVIIVNYNTSKLTLDCIASLREHTTGVSYEIIVVDNASPADAMLPQLKALDGITFVQSDENLGFGKANNLGLLHAKGEYIFFLNSDTILLNNALKLFLDYAEQNADKHVGAVGAMLQNRAGEEIHSYGHFPTFSEQCRKLIITPVQKLFRRNTGIVAEAVIGSEATVDYVTGADLFVRRAVLDECGAFHPAFFMYYEETEMQHRFQQHGYSSHIIRGPRIIHLEGESVKGNGQSQFLRDTLRQERSLRIYFRLTMPRAEYLLFRIVYPLMRQTLWLNPHVSFKDKWQLMKVIFSR